jgi:hypothetical protein
MLSDDTGHLTFSIGCKTLKVEANQKGGVGALVAKFVGHCGGLSRPDDLCRKGGVRYAQLMASGVALGLCGVEVECGNATQEFRPSVKVKTGTASAEVDHQCC